MALLQTFGNELEKIRLHKLLFLFSILQKKAEYDFIPYKYGCYSHSVNADITTMISKGLLTESAKNINKPGKINYVKMLRPDDLNLLEQVKVTYGKLSTKALMRHTYVNYPFYAIRSEVADNILTKDELKMVADARPNCDKTALFTIGYEGISLETYLVRLLKNDIKVLVDVRRNPLSMKYGFSKTLLKRYCENLGVRYVHVPEVGIQSDQRQELNTQADYDKLFATYCKASLPITVDSQTSILNLLVEYKRIALTCFEANICQCHRKPLAEAIERLSGFDYEVVHI